MEGHTTIVSVIVCKCRRIGFGPVAESPERVGEGERRATQTRTHQMMIRSVTSGHSLGGDAHAVSGE